MTFELSWERFAFGALLFGGLAFLNLWDFPLYVGLFAGAYVLKLARERGWGGYLFGQFLLLGLLFGLAGTLLYLPFFISFSSQAGGILPNMINPTRGIQLWVMFGPLFLLLFAFLLYLNQRRGWRRLTSGLMLALGFALSLWLLSVLYSVMAVYAPPLMAGINPEAGNLSQLFLGRFGGRPLGEVLQVGLSRRAQSLGGVLTLVLLLGLAAAALWPSKDGEKQSSEPADTFALLLVLFGGLLVLAPEFFFLIDNFGTRMNTIFKFYIQGWLLWGTAAGYGTAVLLGKEQRRRWVLGFMPGLLAACILGLSYPLYAIPEKIQQFNDNEISSLQLDGTAHNIFLSLEDHEAVAFLQQAPLGTLVEAVGGSYTQYARISAHSGQPALLGWPGHENQWRGGNLEMGTRQADIERLYTTGSWAEAQAIIDQYQIEYIYLGNLERTTYQVSAGKFEQFLTPVFRQGSVTIYQAP